MPCKITTLSSMSGASPIFENASYHQQRPQETRPSRKPRMSSRLSKLIHRKLEAAGRLQVWHPSPQDIHEDHNPPPSHRLQFPPTPKSHRPCTQHQIPQGHRQHIKPLAFATSGPLNDDEYGLGLSDMQPYVVALEAECRGMAGAWMN
jgi:hypothetical protein